MNSDESTRELKGEGRPINSLRQRVLDLYMSGQVNAVIPFDGDPVLLLDAIPVHVLIRGEDQSNEGMANAGEFVRIPRLQGFSTTRILQSCAPETCIELLTPDATTVPPKAGIESLR